MHILLLTELFLNTSRWQWLSGEQTEGEVRGQPPAVITSQSSPHFLPWVLTVTWASEPDEHPSSTHNPFTCECWVTQAPLKTQISWALGKSTANDLDKVRVSTTRKKKTSMHQALLSIQGDRSIHHDTAFPQKLPLFPFTAFKYSVVMYLVWLAAQLTKQGS